MRYIALVDGKAGAYGVVVPDLPGCTSAGSTTDEALRNAVEAVRLWVEDAIDAGEALPPSSSVEALRADPEIAAALAEGAALAIVPLLLDAGRAVRANLSLDAGLLDAIDDAAKAHGLTRSAFLASAAREKIEGRAGSQGCLSTHPQRAHRVVAAMPTNGAPNSTCVKSDDLSGARAEPHEHQTDTTKTMAEPSKHEGSRFDAMREAQRDAAATRDPDAVPLPSPTSSGMKKTTQVS